MWFLKESNYIPIQHSRTGSTLYLNTGWIFIRNVHIKNLKTKHCFVGDLGVLARKVTLYCFYFSFKGLISHHSLLQQNNKMGRCISNVVNCCIKYRKFILLTCFWTSASLSAIVICQLNNGLKTIHEAKYGNKFYKILLLSNYRLSTSRRSYDPGTAAHVKLHVIDVLQITKMKAIYE